MVGGGGKKKGKSGPNNPTAQGNAAPGKVNNVATPAPTPPAATPLVNKENQQPPSIDPTLDTAEIKTSDAISISSERNDTGSVLNITPDTTMETPVVSAESVSSPPPPSSSLWTDVDIIPEFVPKSIPLEPNVKQQPAPPLSSNGPALQPPLIPVASAPADKGWTPNISANPFLPTSAPGPYVNTTFQSQGVNLVQNIYQGPIPISTPLNYPPFKVPGPFYVQQMYPGGPQPQPGQKHIMTRPGPPGNTYEPVGQMPYGVDIHSMPHKQETVQINLNGAKKPQYSVPYQHPPYLIGDPLTQYQMTIPVGNNIQVVPKPQVPVSREPVNVSAANLSNEPPAIPKSYTHPFVVKDKPRLVEQVEVQQPKPVAELKINSVMKVEETVEDDLDEVKPSEEKVTPLPTSAQKEVPQPKVHEKPAMQPTEVASKKKVSPEVMEKIYSPAEEKPRVSPPTATKKEPSPPAVEKKSSEDKKSAPSAKVEAKEKLNKADKVDKVDGLASSKTPEPKLEVKPAPVKVEQRPKLVESQVAKSEQPPKAEVKPVDKTKELPPPVSQKENKDVEKPVDTPVAKIIEKETAPPSSKPSGPAAFNFNSLTNISDVKINDADKFRSSVKQRSLNKNTEEDENSDPNRKKYSRDQLMGLKNTPASIKLPEGFNKSIDIFSEGAGSRSGSMILERSAGGFNNMTNFTTGGGSYRGSSSQHYRERDLPPMIIHSVSLREDVQLKTTENAWKPGSSKKDPVERVVMDAKSLLNKLSPENFDSILKKFVQLQINEDTMPKIIDVIMFKAVWEPKFAEVYARFIEGMKKHESMEKKKKDDENKKKGIKPPVKKEDEKDDLPTLLMKKCAAEFESIVKSEKEAKAKLEAIKKIADEKEREEARVSYEEEEMLGRKKSVGVMTFIGELFKLKLLHPRILHSCFHEMLRRGNDVENLECLAKLITSTGKAVEMLNTGKNEHAAQSKGSWDQVMTAVKTLVADKNKDKIPSRIRFMFLDVLDLKSRNWIPRMVENKPKTMAQIDKDIENEAMRRNVQMRDDDRNPPMSKVPNKKPQQGQAPPSQQPSFQKIEKIDVDKFKALTQDHMELNLRPMMPSFMNMSSGATGASGFKSSQNKARGNFSMSSPAPPAPLTQKNSFSVLSMPEPTQPPPVVDNKTRSTPASNVNRTPQKLKQAPATPAETKPTPVAIKDDNLAFEKLLAADKDVKNNFDIEDKYLELLTYGKHFTDEQDFKTSNNQYREEVNILVARCLNHLNEPMYSVHRLEKLYIGFVDKIEKEVNSLGKDKFDARGLTRSLLLDLLAKRPADHIFVTALLISLIEKHKKWGSCVELLKDFQIFCTKSDIREDYPNVIKVIGDIFGYLICFRSLSLADYKKQMLIKYVENVSSTVFVQMVRCIARLKGPQFLFECFPSEESLKEYLSPLFYLKYKSSTEFETLDLKEKLQDRFKLGFLLDKNLTSDQPCRVNIKDDHLGLINICLHYYVSSPPDNSSSADYLSLNFPMSLPAVAADVYFALTQKICYESLEPQVSGDEEVVTYKLNDAKFKELYRTRLVSTLQSLDVVLSSLYSILDVNLHLQLPGGLLLSQFVVVKELLVDSPLGGDLAVVNAPFRRFSEDKSMYHVPASPLATVLSKELAVQESGFSKTSALPSLKNFYNQIEEEEEESEGETEEGEK